MRRRAFDAEILEVRRGGAWVEIPFDVKEAFGSGRPKVKAIIDGHVYRGSLASMDGRHVLGLRKDVRAAIGKGVGDRVHVTVEPDTEPRESLGASPEAGALFDAMSYTHRKEYARWVGEAKKEETRDRRAGEAVEMLLEGKRL
jgi:hypothetical protein